MIAVGDSGSPPEASFTSRSRSSATATASAWFRWITWDALVDSSGTSSLSMSRSVSAMTCGLPLRISELSRSLATISTRCGPLAALPIRSGAIFSSTVASVPTQACSSPRRTTSSVSTTSSCATSARRRRMLPAWSATMSTLGFSMEVMTPVCGTSGRSAFTTSAAAT